MRTTIGIAIDIPDPWGEQLTRRRAEAGDPQAAHVPAHVTLLGPTEIDAADLGVIERELGVIAAAHPEFVLHLRGTGTFRPITEVVFVAVAAGISECERLNAVIQDIPVIDRVTRFPYHPHVTVAQDVSSEQLDAVFRDLAGFEAQFPVKGFTLFEHGSAGRWRPCRDYVFGAANGPDALADNGG
ncbi:2'-5' RNA ligase family protein [Planosporangium sp. 12N6]|uniref:2'-5' RNA ligase family protein n=1 Tax=Planosporangium spinosum TaxID=3402278 RepID=UPI003CE6C212